MTSLSAHTSDFNNPHEVTAEQAGLGNLENFRLATKQELLALTRDDLYVDRDSLFWVNEAFVEYLKSLGLVDAGGELIVIPDDVGDVTLAIDSSGNGWLIGTAYQGDSVNVEIFKEDNTIFEEAAIETIGDDKSWEANGVKNVTFVHGDNYKAKVHLFDGAGEYLGLKTVEWVDGDWALYEAHMDEVNPHYVSAHNVGLGLVENEKPATPASTKTETEDFLTEVGFVKIKY